MGCCQTTSHLSSLEKYNKNGINRGPKVLLLGIGGSGKSTCLKQLTNTYDTIEEKIDGYEAKQYIPHIFDEILTSIKRLIDSKDRKYSPIKNDPILNQLNFNNIVESIEFIYNLPYIAEITNEIQNHLQILWNDKNIQILFKYRSKLSVPDSFEYFMNNFDRICTTDYTPNDTDILQLHWPTTAILETTIKMRDTNVTIVDVGGLRNERKKWLYCLESTNVIIYLVSLSSYNETLLEDHTKNALIEALELFEMQINNEIFAPFEFIMFFNKVDLLEKKLNEKIPLTEAFPQYKKDNFNVSDATRYITKEFMNKIVNPNKQLQSHVTSFINHANAQQCFDIVQNSISKYVV